MYESKKQYHYGTGRRKSSIARVRVYENGTGSIIINGREIDDYFGLDTLKLIVRQPLVTTDLLMEGVHFDLVYTPLKHLGYKSAMVNFSDIYAMNGTPKQITVSLAVSKRFCIEDLEDFYDGLKQACAQHQVDLVGGDTTSSVTGLAISITCIGEADNAGEGLPAQVAADGGGYPGGKEANGHSHGYHQQGERQHLAAQRAMLLTLMTRRLKQERQRVAQLAGARALRDPKNYIDDRRMQLDYTQRRLIAALQRLVAQQRERFVRLTSKLDAMSPLKVLSRGYSMTFDAQGYVVRSVRTLSCGDRIADGRASAEVREIQEDAT